MYNPKMKFHIYMTYAIGYMKRSSAKTPPKPIKRSGVTSIIIGMEAVKRLFIRGLTRDLSNDLLKIIVLKTYEYKTGLLTIL